jgi:hypothetical protein
LISSDPEDIAAMRKASRDPKMLLISDWTHVTSEEYMQIQKDSNVGTLWVTTYALVQQREYSTNLATAALTVF